MDPQLAAAVKEEILRNVVKVHRRIMVAGWGGTGKTVAALRAGKGLFDVYYFNSRGDDRGPLITRVNDTVKILGDIRDFRADTSRQPLLIVDDADKITGALREPLAEILSGMSGEARILLITRVLVDVKELLPEMDVVVRFRQDAAEVLLTNLCDLDHI